LRRIVFNMGTNAVQRDATAETVSANVKGLRTKQNLGLRGLSKKLGEVGRPLGHSAVDQIEKGTRRVDVDDLMALALALGVSPVTLLMPNTKEPTDKVATAGAAADIEAERLWKWMLAQAPLFESAPEELFAFLGRALPSWRVAQQIQGLATVVELEVLGRELKAGGEGGYSTDRFVQRRDRALRRLDELSKEYGVTHGDD
jgi:transcriptional regulator with XRE-family HTH domain